MMKWLLVITLVGLVMAPAPPAAAPAAAAPAAAAPAAGAPAAPVAPATPQAQSGATLAPLPNIYKQDRNQGMQYFDKQPCHPPPCPGYVYPSAVPWSEEAATAKAKADAKKAKAEASKAIAAVAKPSATAFIEIETPEAGDGEDQVIMNDEPPSSFDDEESSPYMDEEAHAPNDDNLKKMNSLLQESPPAAPAEGAPASPDPAAVQGEIEAQNGDMEKEDEAKKNGQEEDFMAKLLKPPERKISTMDEATDKTIKKDEKKLKKIRETIDKKMKEQLAQKKWMTMASDTLSVVDKQVKATTQDRDNLVAAVKHIEKDKHVIQRKIRRDKIMVALTKLKLTLGNLEMEHTQVEAQKEGLENAKNNLDNTKADLEKHLGNLQSQALALGVKSAANLEVEAREETSGDLPDEA